MMHFAKTIMLMLALLAIVTGAADIINGLSAQENLGVTLDHDSLADPVLDSQIRYLGTIWLGYGALLLYCLRDIRSRRRLAIGALLLVVLGGFARLLSTIQLGMPVTAVGTSFILLAFAIELVLVPAAAAALWLAPSSAQALNREFS